MGLFLRVMKFLKFISIFVLFEIGMSSRTVQVRGNQVQKPRLPDNYRHIQPPQHENFPKFSAELGPTGGRNEFSDQGTVERADGTGTEFNPRKFSQKVHKAVCPDENDDK